MEEQLHKYFLGELGRQEQRQLLQAIEKDSALKQQFIEIKNLYALSASSSQPNDREENIHSYTQFRQRQRKAKMKRISLRIAGYAAAIAILVGSTYWFTMQHASKEWPTEMLSLHVPAGQRLQLTLQDGTSVWLNARTTITYPSHFPSSERRVSIDGEALFDVAKENSRPFIVSSRGVEMEVLGTEFNLYSYPEAEYIRTSLLEGSLSVYRTQEKRKNIILEPNQQVTIKGRQMLVDKIPDPAYFLWTEGVYSFHNEPLINILRKLELYYDVKIEVKDPSIYTWEYTGKFRQRDGIDEILRIINKIHKFTIEKDEENNKIILS